MQCCLFISVDPRLGAWPQPCSRGTAGRGPTRAIPSCSASEVSMWHHQEKSFRYCSSGKTSLLFPIHQNGDCPVCHTGGEQENRQKNISCKALTMRRRFLLILTMIFFLKNWVKSTPCMNGRMFKDTDDAENVADSAKQAQRWTKQ